MIEVKKKLYCPQCLAANVVKNGIKSSGEQNYLCRKCGKQFQKEYFYQGCCKHIKMLVISMLVNGCGVRAISRVLKISIGCVLRTLVKAGELVNIRPQKTHYHMVQIDELYSFVGNKRKKVWVIYAYDTESKEILAMTAGKRSSKQVRDLMKRLADIEVDFWCTDLWSSFSEVLPEGKHLKGKQFTKAIEGVNTALRNSCRRLHRRTVCFSKKVPNHWYALKLTVYQFNNKLSYI